MALLLCAASQAACNDRLSGKPRSHAAIAALHGPCSDSGSVPTASEPHGARRSVQVRFAASGVRALRTALDQAAEEQPRAAGSAGGEGPSPRHAVSSAGLLSSRPRPITFTNSIHRVLSTLQAEDVRGGAQRPAEASPSRSELTRRHSAKAAQELAAAKAEASDLREQVASLVARAELLETKHAAREAELRQRLVASEGKSSRLQLALQSSGAHGRASREEHEQAKRAAEEARRAQEHAVSCDLERLAASLVETEERLRRSEEERERTASEVLSAREEADQAARALGEASEARARLEAQSKDRILELATTKAAIEAEHVAQVASLQKRHEAELEIEVHKAVRRAEAEAQAAAAAVAAETEAAAARRHAEDLLGSVRVAVLAPCVRLVVNDHEALAAACSVSPGPPLPLASPAQPRGLLLRGGATPHVPL